MSEEFSGTFEKIRWINDEETFFIGVMRCGTVIKGNIITEKPSPGLSYTMHGKWVTHPQWGKQFEFSSMAVVMPVSRDAVITYLIKYTYGCGIGPVTAERICIEFGDSSAVKVLRENPQAVASKIEKLRPEQAEKASLQLRMHQKHEQVMIELTELFQGRGFSQECIARCIDKWGANAARVIRRNPFRMLMARMPSAGFGRCDDLYLDLGNNPDRISRQAMCIWHFVNSPQDNSVWVQKSQCVYHLKENVSSGELNFDLALEFGIQIRWLAVEVFGGNTFIATHNQAEYENQIVESVSEMLGFKKHWIDEAASVDASPQDLERSLGNRKRAVG